MTHSAPTPRRRPPAAHRPAHQRVVVTGYGVVSPAGVGAEATWQGLHRPQQTGRVRRVDDDALRLHDHVDPRTAKRLDRFAQLAVVAAREAVDHAALPDDAVSSSAVVVGTGMGGLPAFEAAVTARLQRGERRISPFTVPLAMPNAAAAAVSMALGTTGTCEAVATACAAGAHSIAHAARLLTSGEADVALAGGAESCLDETSVGAFAVMTALTKTGESRPFDRRRDGFAAGEGAAVLVLETLQHARDRGATPLVELLGAGSSADAHHLTAPPPDGAGAARCMRAALASAGLDPDDVTHVNAHGTSTPLNDAAEAAALRAVLGDAPPPVTSVKGVTGHTLGAAGAVEAVAVALSVAHRQLPPTAGTTDLDDLELDVVTEPRRWQPGPVLSNSFGFGGHNATLVLGPVQDGGA